MPTLRPFTTASPALVSVALVLVVSSPLTSRERRSSAGWTPSTGGGVVSWPTADGRGGSHYSPLDDVRPANVASLEVAWTYHTGDVRDGGDGVGATAFEATPVMVDGVLYVSTPSSRVVALDAETGRKLWTFDPILDARGQALVTSRGVSVWVDEERTDGEPCRRRVFLATLDARLFALDAGSGRPCVDFGSRGFVDLAAGVDRIEGRRRDYGQTAPPTVVSGLVVVGSKISDGKVADAPSGVVRAFDARTGEKRWSFEPLSGVGGLTPSGEYVPAGAGNTWATITADPERDLLFLPTGSPSPDHWGGLRLGDNLYANSLVALRATTGEVVWHFQMVHHDLWDYDLPAPAALVTVRRAGREIPAVAQATKMGYLFILDRETGEPLFPVEERPVPASDVPGEVASPTQPVPARPRPLVPQSLGPDDAWGLTPLDRGACRRQIEGLRSEGIFTPPSRRGSIVYPGFLGGMEWGGVAFDPSSGLLVTNTNRLATVTTLIPPPEATREGMDEKTRTSVARQTPAPWAVRRGVLLSPLGVPCTAPPWGMLHAVDAATGVVRWEVPLGSSRDITRVPLPWRWGSVNLGGPTISGGVVFIAASMDRTIRAFDLKSGEELWEHELPASGQSTPMTYRARPGGRQYVVVAAGGHAALHSSLGDSVVAFALPVRRAEERP